MADPPIRQWPTVDGDKGHTAIDKERVKKLLAALVQDLKAYQEGASVKKGTPSELSNTLSQITPTSIGASQSGQTVKGDEGSSYPAGNMMWKTIQSINGTGMSGGGTTGAGFTGEYADFVTQYAQVVDALYKAAGVQEDADTQSIISDVGGSGTSTAPSTQTSDGTSGKNGSYDNGSQS